LKHGGNEEDMKKISILLADDHAVVREGLRALLSAEADIEIVCEAENGWQALKMTKEKHPDVVIMDLAMPSLNGIEATRMILREAPATKIIALTSYTNDDYIRDMVQAGASGYLNKQTAAQDLMRAIREVHRGNAFFSGSIAKRLRNQSREAALQRAGSRKSTGLTDREEQVLQMIADGCSNKEMGTHLGISVKTVEKHRQQLMNKLDIHDIAGLTRYAVNRTPLKGQTLEEAAGKPALTATADQQTGQMVADQTTAG
jgi:DNA-binding NarL/FixJ family response regulator